MTERERKTRERILDATIELVAEVGWGGVTTRLVAERADVNNAAVNYHFSTKAELLREAANLNMHRALEAPMLGLLAAPRLADGVRAMLAWIRDADPGTPAMAMLLETMLQAPRDEALRGLLVGGLREARAAIAAKIVAEQAAGQLRADLDPAGAAAAIAALGDGVLLHRIVDPELDTSGVDSAIDALLGAP